MGDLGEESHTSVLLEWSLRGLLTVCLPPPFGNILPVPKLSKAGVSSGVGNRQPFLWPGFCGGSRQKAVKFHVEVFIELTVY